MRVILNILSGFVSVYMLVIFLRVIMSWFSGINSTALEKPYAILCRICDPYLNWFRRFSFLRIGRFDFSPLAALLVLSLVSEIINTVAVYGAIKLGIVLALILRAVWSAISLITGFFIIMLIIRLIAYLTNRNIYSSFWRIIDGLAQPVLYRLNRILFRARIVHFLTGLLCSLALLLVLWLCGNILVGIGIRLLSRLPF